MTTWTPATSQTETWTASASVRGVFSQLAFSHASSGGKHVFAFGNTAGAEGWYRATTQSETWTGIAAP